MSLLLLLLNILTIFKETPMCGLVGMVGNLSFKHEKAFKQLLIVDSLRGMDSTGIATVNRNSDEPKVAKMVGNPWELFDSGPFSRAMTGQLRVLIGHNRFATQGGVTKRNAHPFEFENIVGAHNGTLMNKHVLDEGNKFAVDSEALYNHIDKHGIEDAVKNLEGAWALTWWDKRDKTINIIRNKERPLYICESKVGDVMFWASEEWMLHATLGRNDIEFTAPWLLEENQHYRVTISMNGAFVKEEFDEVKSHFKKFVAPYTGGTGAWGSPSRHLQQQQQTVEKKTEDAPKTVTASITVLKQPEQKKRVESLTGSETLYGGKVGRKLTVTSIMSDRNGAAYLNCFDEEHADLDIRLYFHVRSDDAEMLGKTIIGDISKFPFSYGGTNLYYKVEHSSVQRPKKEEKDGFEPLHYDHKGDLLNEKDWIKKYGACCWCSSPVSPTEEFKFTKDADVLCQDCAISTEVVPYVALM
jgi:predicted glutamine amidotransferase